MKAPGEIRARLRLIRTQWCPKDVMPDDCLPLIRFIGVCGQVTVYCTSVKDTSILNALTAVGTKSTHSPNSQSLGEEEAVISRHASLKNTRLPFKA